MTRTAGTRGEDEIGQNAEDRPRIVRATGALRVAAAERLVSVPRAQRRRAARGLLKQAPTIGIDLDMIWVCLRPGGDEVAQACMIVPGAGRTAMVFLSPPDRAPEPPDEARLRTLLLEESLRLLHGHPRVGLAQALPEPGETWSLEACRNAGMTPVGELSYLRAAMPEVPPGTLGMDDGEWPEGIRAVAVSDLDPDVRDRILERTLEKTYADTLDCPELCGLRTPQDVLESHRATGAYDPSRWWVIESGGAAEGCVLMSHCPDQSSVELVYLGLSPALRGRGLGREILSRAIVSCAGTGAERVTCAVDRRNEPARRVYAALGFEEFTSRHAFVRVV